MIPTIVEEDIRVVAIYKDLYNLLSDHSKELLEDNLECISCLKFFSSNPCSCGNTIVHPLLEHLQERNFGRVGSFWGLYFVDEANWLDISESVHRDRELYKNSSPQLIRYEWMQDNESVQDWLDSTFPDNNLTVKSISIPCIEPPSPKESELYEIFKTCFRNSETKLHGYLKWFSFNYLTKGGISLYEEPISLCGIGFEVKYSLPGNRFITRYNGGKGSIVPDSWEWDWSSCIQKIADIYFGSDKVIVECGATDALSLSAPIKAKVAKKVIWLPYPENISKHDCMDHYDFKCQAYLIHNQQPKHLRKSS